ncbi:MAG TPA: Crp/Fnr family transcriptional regulator [Thermoanaerobaculia bacterium]|jgi:CRP-like cAMP-binding protein
MTRIGVSARSGGSALLAAFPPEVRAHLAATDEDHASHDVLINAGVAPKWLYLPHRNAVVSLTRSSEAGGTVEVGIVGWEGLVSAHVLLDPGATGMDAVVQIAGMVSRVDMGAMREALDGDANVRKLLHLYIGIFLTQVSQHALCNRLHSIEQRLAKWLLGVHDRIDSDELGLTHDFLSHMIGIRRSGVTVAIGALALDGLIVHSRQSITIIDREGLEARTCECYRVIAAAFRPLLERLDPDGTAPAAGIGAGA